MISVVIPALDEERALPVTLRARVRWSRREDDEGGPAGMGLSFADVDAVFLKGGDQGASFIPGDPAGSALMKAVLWTDPDFKMPPKERMPKGEVDLLESWIRKGAPWGAAAKPAAKPATPPMTAPPMAPMPPAAGAAAGG